MKICAAAVVLFIDGFTGLAIADAGTFSEASGRFRIIRKPEGYFVFLENGEKVLNLNVGGGCYQRKNLTIDLENLKKRVMPCLTVYLYPSASYIFPSGIICRKIENEELKSPEAVLWRDSQDAVSLLKDCLFGDESVFLKADKALPLEDRFLYFHGIKDDKPVLIKLLECVDFIHFEYRLNAPADRNFDCRETKVYLAYEAFSDSDGEYRIPQIDM